MKKEKRKKKKKGSKKKERILFCQEKKKILDESDWYSSTRWRLGEVAVKPKLNTKNDVSFYSCKYQPKYKIINNRFVILKSLKHYPMELISAIRVLIF